MIPLLEPTLSETDQLVEMNKLAIALQQQTLTLMDVSDRILQNLPNQTGCSWLPTNLKNSTPFVKQVMQKKQSVNSSASWTNC
ncbi:MAG: hypothetical protein HC833_17090 [Leptolyngbyaceae cyanobacterium RM1_406_9]|nr:hypothetical protein [Leptolyngbyaceae cyanobacterium RM1_406_9]